jgi:hypothetical protein
VSLEPHVDTSRSPFAPSGWELQVASRFGLVSDGRLKLSRLVPLAIAVTWLPLLALTLIEGTAFGTNVTMPFLAEHIPHGRFLVALPLLLLMSPWLERRTSFVMAHLYSSDLIAKNDREGFERAVSEAARAWRSKKTWLVLLVVTYAAAVFSLLYMRELEFSSWMFPHENGTATLSAAGAWNLLVSAPLTRLLLLAAVWKLAIWVRLLYRLARLRLRVEPLHPDGRCGLRFLGEAQVVFSALIAALSVQVGCVIADAVKFEGLALAGARLMAAVFVVLSLVVVLSPLLMFVEKAWLAKERAENTFSAWATLAARYMSTRVLHAGNDGLPTRLGSSEISSITDASAQFEGLIRGWPIPIDLRQIATLLVAAVVPMLFPLLALLPLTDIAQGLVRVLL